MKDDLEERGDLDQEDAREDWKAGPLAFLGSLNRYGGRVAATLICAVVLFFVVRAIVRYELGR